MQRCNGAVAEVNRLPNFIYSKSIHLFSVSAYPAFRIMRFMQQNRIIAERKRNRMLRTKESVTAQHEKGQWISSQAIYFLPSKKQTYYLEEWRIMTF